MNKVKLLSGIVLLGVLQSGLLSCSKENPLKRTFTSSFENVSDFDGFYITPQGHLNSSFHDLSDSIVFTGSLAHRAWIKGSNPPSTSTVNNNHRGYPTVQLYKTSGGSFTTPCYITFKVWLDMPLQASQNGGENDWFSFATFSDDETDGWARTILVNLSYDGHLHLQHVPNQGQQQYIFQTSTVVFPQKEWVEVKVYLDFGKGKYAKVWQNGVLVSHAHIENINNQLSQAHFGLYAPPQIESGVVFNDELIIEMVDGE
ncbi:MAG: hypothetical protein OEY34_04395 [Cyclobacteriaceae bacterium]|nr:hypothetical protein [Cyclobacteriaceae bacterium]